MFCNTKKLVNYNKIRKIRGIIILYKLFSLGGIKGKLAYTKAGVKLDDFGAAQSTKSINGNLPVVFLEFYTGKNIADKIVNEADLKVLSEKSKLARL